MFLFDCFLLDFVCLFLFCVCVGEVWSKFVFAFRLFASGWCLFCLCIVVEICVYFLFASGWFLFVLFMYRG